MIYKYFRSKSKRSLNVSLFSNRIFYRIPIIEQSTIVLNVNKSNYFKIFYYIRNVLLCVPKHTGTHINYVKMFSRNIPNSLSAILKVKLNFFEVHREFDCAFKDNGPCSRFFPQRF